MQAHLRSLVLSCCLILAAWPPGQAHGAPPIPDCQAFRQELNRRLAEFDRPPLSHDDVKALIVNGLCKFLANLPHDGAASEEDAFVTLTKEVALTGKFTMPVELAIFYLDKSYTVNPEADAPLVISGPDHWEITMKVTFAASDVQIFYTLVPLGVIAADKDKH